MSELNNTVEQREDRLQVHNVGSYTFEQTGNSSVSDSMGMRQMQSRAFEKRNSQYLLIQAPPACGKSRALMFLALDKVINQGIDKVIISVPQIAIGSSFADTELSKFGFFADWHIDSKYNLCAPGNEAQKVDKALEFLNDKDAHYLLCSHATLVYFYAKVKDRNVFNKALVAVDEFHHVSQDTDNKLGNVIHSLMTTTDAHIIAMTGSYFRGDTIPVLSEEDEAKFDRVIYTYYEQLNGYKYLKSLGIDYAFYDGSWINAVELLIDLDKKTIIHIPSVNSRESTHDKFNEVNKLIDYIGKLVSKEADTGIITLKTKHGKTIKVADLVSNAENGVQSNTLAALRDPEVLNSIDIIIALGMAKEGFDWPQCEYALTVGYRSSLTEVVQIIGRATRDYPGKEHAQFTNLLAMPCGSLNDVKDAVNSLLKAITLSLLMEQVLAPNVHFRARPSDYDVPKEETEKEKTDKPKYRRKDTKPSDPNSIKLTVSNEISEKGIEFLNTNYQGIVEKVLNSSDTVKASIANGGNETTKELVAEDVSEVIRKSHPEFSDAERHELALQIVKAMVVKSCSHQVNFVKEEADDNKQKPKVQIVRENDTTFLKFKDKLVNVDDVDFNMIGSINPFADAYMFVSKALNPKILKLLQTEVTEKRLHMSAEIAQSLWPYINQFYYEHKRAPDVFSSNDYEKRLASALNYIKKQKRLQNSLKKPASSE